MIVDCDVTDVPKENLVFLESMDRIAENFERSPERAMADKAMGTIVNLKGMESRNIDFYTPVESPLPEPGNPALLIPHRSRGGGDGQLPRWEKLANRASSTKRRTPLTVRWVDPALRQTANAGAKGETPSAAIVAGSANCPLASACLTPNASMPNGQPRRLGAVAGEDGGEAEYRKVAESIIAASISRRRRSPSSARWAFGNFYCAAWRKCGPNGVGRVPPTT
jgi:hypothetical protein